MNITFILFVIFCSVLLLGNLNENIFGATTTGTITIIQNSPTILSVIADDPDGGDSVFSNGDVIIVKFSEATNKPVVVTKDNLDALFTLSSSLGTNYTGNWKNPSTLIITIQDSIGNGNPAVGTFTLTLKSTGNLKVAGGQSLASTDQSPVLQGSFGNHIGPYMTSVIADDPDGGDSVFSNGDVIIVKFSEATNKPVVVTKDNLDALFTFSSSLGTNYTGNWKNPSTLIITIQDSIGNGNPAVGTFTLTLKSTGNLKVAGGQSLASTDQSPVLQGSFGTFSTTIFGNADDFVTTVLPSGTSMEIKLPVAGGMKITKSNVSTSLDSGTLSVIGDVIDITPVSGASCTSGCVILITFTQDDLISGKASDVSIFHDINGNGRFSQDEKLSTVITIDSSGVFTANATTFSNSIFAAGTVSFPLTGGGGGSSGDKTKPTLESALLSSSDSVIYGGTLKLDNTAQHSASIFEIGDKIDIELLFYENSGTEYLEHVTLFTNIRNFDSRYDSNLYVEWNKGKSLKIYDPEGYLVDENSVSFRNDDLKTIMTFHLTFVKPMELSNIVLNYWDFKRNSGLETFVDVWNIIEPVNPEIPEINHDDFVSDETSIQNPLNVLEKETLQLTPSWFKKNAGLWADEQIKDSIFTNGIRYLVEKNMLDIKDPSSISNNSNEHSQDLPLKTPSWVKNNAKWWSQDFISEQEFLNSLRWLISNGILRI